VKIKLDKRQVFGEERRLRGGGRQERQSKQLNRTVLILYCCHWHFKTFAKCSCLLHREEIEGALNCIINLSPRVKEKLRLHSALALLQRQRSGKPHCQPGRGASTWVWGTGGQAGARQKVAARQGKTVARLCNRTRSDQSSLLLLSTS